MWSSAAGAHLLQGSMCCVFRDAILQILVVTSGYLSYCCLSIISNLLIWNLLSFLCFNFYLISHLNIMHFCFYFSYFSIQVKLT